VPALVPTRASEWGRTRGGTTSVPLACDWQL